MAISEEQFLIPSTGAAPGDALNALAGKLYARNIQSQRLGLAQEGRREQAGSFLHTYLDPKQYLTGTAYDPVINQKLQMTLQKGAQLAAQGADIPTMLTALGPDVSEISDYSTKARTINKQIDDNITKMKAQGYKGVDYAKLKDTAMGDAFHQVDPKTGQVTGLKNANDVDATQDYALQAIQKHPEDLTTNEDFKDFAHGAEKNKRLADIKSYDANGMLNQRRVQLTGPNYTVPDVDDKGATIGMVPKYDTAADEGKPIMHTFQDANGKPVNAPVRLLDEGLFDQIMHEKPLAADYLKGQLKQHLKEYNDSTGQNIDMNDPKAKLVARALAYDELNKQGGSSIESADIVNKPSAQQIQLKLFGGKEQQSYDRTMGSVEAHQDTGTLPGANKAPNAAQTWHSIFNNDPDYLAGDKKTINPTTGKDDPSGTPVVDVTGSFPGATLRFGRGAADVYDKEYYDPQKRQMILVDKAGKSTVIPENQSGQFLTKVAGANKIAPSAIRSGLDQAGFKNGKYASPGEASPLINDLQQSKQVATTQKIKTGIDNLITDGKGASLAGLQTPDGTVVTAGARGAFNLYKYGKGNYYITVKDANGKTQDKNFDSRGEMESYLSSGAPAASPTTSKKGKFD